MQEGRWLSLPNLRAFGAGVHLTLLAWGNFLASRHTQAPWAKQGVLCRLFEVQHRRGFAAGAERLKFAYLLARASSLDSDQGSC